MIGIDVASWQGDIRPSELKRNGRKLDFCISKATQGTDYVNPYCDGVIQDCISNDIQFGYYHYAFNLNARQEARFFWNNTLGYAGNGIPCLDYEEWGKISNPVEWCETFLEEYKQISGVYPLLYISASHCKDFAGSWVPRKCGLWVAGYPQDYNDWPNMSDMPYDVHPWEFAAIWQFASDWRMSGYDGDLDANTANMVKGSWMLYAGSKEVFQTPTPNDMKSCTELANEVLQGKWGNGWNRKNALDAAYGTGTYDHVQAIVNMKLGLDGC